ncbi:MAG: disulfide bond formation protein B [Alcanivoracaceae bacterium]|nr:disulfide bond formation protein B [Alcanivoracaceae bacterium]
MPTLNTLLAPRLVTLAGFLICAGAMAAALYIQHVDGLEPCPLCIFQRVGVTVAGLFFLLAFAHNPGALGQRIYAALAGAGAIGGAIVAGRHVWLQHLPPDEIPDCGPGLDYMLDVFPMQDVIGLVLHGSGECAELSWQFLGLSMPAWVLVLCVGLTAMVLFQLFRPYRAQ